MPKADTLSAQSAPSTPLPLAVGQRVKVTLDSHTGGWEDPIVEVCEVVSVDSDGGADMRLLASNDNPESVDSVSTYYASDLAQCRVEVVEAAPTTITVTRTKVYPRPARRGRAWYWSYDCVGPDGRRFDNTSIVTLRQVLRRYYGKGVTVEVQP